MTEQGTIPQKTLKKSIIAALIGVLIVAGIVEVLLFSKNGDLTATTIRVIDFPRRKRNRNHIYH